MILRKQYYHIICSGFIILERFYCPFELSIDVLIIEFHLKYWNTGSFDIPDRSYSKVDKVLTGLTMVIQ